MVKVIETNVSLDNKGIPVDVQSRVIEAESWDKYLDEVFGDTPADKRRSCCIGSSIASMIGSTRKVSPNCEVICKTDYNFIIHTERNMYQMAYCPAEAFSPERISKALQLKGLDGIE